jgi:hypothetical protein
MAVTRKKHDLSLAYSNRAGAFVNMGEYDRAIAEWVPVRRPQLARSPYCGHQLIEQLTSQTSQRPRAP